MTYVFESERLGFRQFCTSDANVLFQLNDNPEVMRYTGDVPFESAEAAKTFLEGYNPYADTGMGRWMCEVKKTGKVIGWCGLKQHDEYVDLGYRLFQEEWGKGYASEAALACTEFAFEQLSLPFLVGRVSNENPASVRVLEKCGMKFWKIDTCGPYPEAIYMRIEKEEFNSKKLPR